MLLNWAHVDHDVDGDGQHSVQIVFTGLSGSPCVLIGIGHISSFLGSPDVAACACTSNQQEDFEEKVKSSMQIDVPKYSCLDTEAHDCGSKCVNKQQRSVSVRTQIAWLNMVHVAKRHTFSGLTFDLLLTQGSTRLSGTYVTSSSTFIPKCTDGQLYGLPETYVQSPKQTHQLCPQCQPSTKASHPCAQPAHLAGGSPLEFHSLPTGPPRWAECAQSHRDKIPAGRDHTGSSAWLVCQCGLRGLRSNASKNDPTSLAQDPQETSKQPPAGNDSGRHPLC